MPPFCYETKRDIKNRAGGYVCEITGRTDRPLEHMHLFHGKGDIYDKPHNGILVTDTIHLAYHMMFWDNPEKIGLDRRGNARAIGSLSARVTEFNYARGLDFEEELSLANEALKHYLSEHEIPTRVQLKNAIPLYPSQPRLF